MFVGVSVAVGVLVGVEVSVGVGVILGVGDGPGVLVGAGIGVAVGLASDGEPLRNALTVLGAIPKPRFCEPLRPKECPLRPHQR